jgi:hypothetical protein
MEKPHIPYSSYFFLISGNVWYQQIAHILLWRVNISGNHVVLDFIQAIVFKCEIYMNRNKKKKISCRSEHPEIHYFHMQKISVAPYGRNRGLLYAKRLARPHGFYAANDILIQVHGAEISYKTCVN